MCGEWECGLCLSFSILRRKCCAPRLRGLQEILPLTLSPPAGSSAPVSLAASLRLPPQTASSAAAAAGSLSGALVRPWLPQSADARVAALAGGPAQQRPVVRISGLLVPDGLTPSVDDGQEAQELGAALGYVTLFLDLAAAYLGSPLLHRVRQVRSNPRRQMHATDMHWLRRWCLVATPCLPRACALCGYLRRPA